MKKLIVGRKIKGIALLDDEDHERIARYYWGVDVSRCTYYACRFVYKDGKYVRQIRMHREVLNLGPFDWKSEVDHINGNGLDNRKCNLRICSHTENMRNRGKQSNNTSGYKGVCWDKDHNRWRSQIKIHGKLYYLGLYDLPEEAYYAYCKKAKEVHGDFFHPG